MNDVQDIPLASIETGQRQRGFDADHAKQIAASFEKIGLQSPINVRATGDGYTLVTGMHRLEAARLSGWETIAAQVIEADEAYAAIHEAWENLLQKQISALARMSHLAHAKVAHDKVYPPRKRGRPKVQTAVAKEAQENSATRCCFPFAEFAAQKSKLQPRTIQDHITVWNGLSELSRQRLWGTDLEDQYRELRLLSQQTEITQELVLRRVLDPAHPVGSVKEAVAETLSEKSSAQETRRASRIGRQITEMDVETRTIVFASCEDQIRQYVASRGWLLKEPIQ